MTSYNDLKKAAEANADEHKRQYRQQLDGMDLSVHDANILYASFCERVDAQTAAVVRQFDEFETVAHTYEELIHAVNNAIAVGDLDRAKALMQEYKDRQPQEG